MFWRIKQIVRRYPACHKVLKKAYYEIKAKRKFAGKYTFVDRSSHSNKVCIILAGYKETIWKDVFGRVERFAPDDVDICVLTSGKYIPELQAMCKEYNWSYLSTKRNCVTLAQNIAISLFPDAEFIYKLDEDIFITDQYFETLFNLYEAVVMEGVYSVGFVAPLIPLNGYANVSVLEKAGVMDIFTNKFGRPIRSGENGEKIMNNPDVAKFFWGNEGVFPHIDLLNTRFSSAAFSYEICPMRFSIGAIMFPRSTWIDMGYFDVGPGNDLGSDENQLCSFCMIHSRIIAVSDNSVVGHFSYGPQTAEMVEYYQINPEKFCIVSNNCQGTEGGYENEQR